MWYIRTYIDIRNYYKLHVGIYLCTNGIFTLNDRLTIFLMVKFISVVAPLSPANIKVEFLSMCPNNSDQS